MFSLGTGDRRGGRRTEKTERLHRDEEKLLEEVGMKEALAEALMTIEAHVVVVKTTVLCAEAWMMIVVHGEDLMMTAAPEEVETMTVALDVALMMTVVQDVALMMREVLVEVSMTPGLPGVGLMMTGAQGEEGKMREVVGEAWMTAHVVVVMTPNPGNPSADLVRLSSAASF